MQFSPAMANPETVDDFRNLWQMQYDAYEAGRVERRAIFDYLEDAVCAKIADERLNIWNEELLEIVMEQESLVVDIVFRHTYHIPQERYINAEMNTSFAHIEKGAPPFVHKLCHAERADYERRVLDKFEAVCTQKLKSRGFLNIIFSSRSSSWMSMGPWHIEYTLPITTNKSL